jgi:hypothetical protein
MPCNSSRNSKRPCNVSWDSKCKISSGSATNFQSKSPATVQGILNDLVMCFGILNNVRHSVGGDELCGAPHAPQYKGQQISVVNKKK